MTIKIISAFIDDQKHQQKAHSTVSSYQSDLLVFARWFKVKNNESFALSRITPTDLRQFKKHLVDEGFKPSTISRKLLTIKYFLEWAWRTKRIKHRLPIPKPVKKVSSAPRWLSNVEQNALMRHFEQVASARDLSIVKILINTGLRVQELCNLRWSEVSLSERKGELTVRHSKGEKYRTVPLNKDARNAFNQMNYQDHNNSDALIFCGQRGYLSPRGIQLMLKRRLTESKLAHVTPHQLRHTFCKNLVDSGVSLEKVAALAGHEKLDTTKIYCKPSFADLSEAVELISEEE